MNYLAKCHRCAFALLFSHLTHEYAPRSVNESFCCWTSAPYLDIIALIRRYQSQETDVDSLEDTTSVSLMTYLLCRHLSNDLPLDLTRCAISSALAPLSTYVWDLRWGTGGWRFLSLWKGASWLWVIQKRKESIDQRWPPAEVTVRPSWPGLFRPV